MSWDPNYWITCYDCGFDGYAPHTCTNWRHQFNSFEDDDYMDGHIMNYTDVQGGRQQQNSQQGLLEEMQKMMHSFESDFSAKLDATNAILDAAMASTNARLAQELKSTNAAVCNLQIQVSQIAQDMEEMDQKYCYCMFDDSSDEENEIVEISKSETVQNSDCCDRTKQVPVSDEKGPCYEPDECFEDKIEHTPPVSKTSIETSIEEQHEIFQLPSSQELNEVIEHDDYAISPIEDLPQKPNLDEGLLEVTQELSSTLSVGEDTHLSTPPESINEAVTYSNPDFLGIEAILERPQQWVIHKATNLHLSVMVLHCTHQAGKDQVCCPKLSLHISVTASTMSLAILAFHGVLCQIMGDFFSKLLQLLLFWNCYIFIFVSYILFALKWKDPP